MRIKIHPYSFFIIFSIIVLAFQYSLASVFSGIQYYDDIFPLVVYVYYLLKIRRWKKEDTMMHLFYATTLLIGIIGNFRSGVHLNALIIFADIISILKPLITLHVIKRTITDADSNRIINACVKLFAIYIYIAAVTAVLAYALNLNYFLYVDRLRYGIKPFRFICENEGIFGYIVMAMVTLFSLSSINTRFIKYAKVLGVILIALTTKGPQLIFVALYVIFYLIRLKKLKFYHIAMVLAVSVFLGQYQLTHYFKPTEARYLLIVTGFMIARDFFPVGSGFGTFGSEMSKHFTYSSIYNDYGISTVYGLSSQFSQYITDNYWSMIVGQLGFIACIILLFYFYKLFININEKQDRSIQHRQIMITSFVTFMVGSIGSAYITSFVGVMNFIIWGIYLSPKVKLKK